MAPQVNWSYQANVASLSTKFSSGSSLLVVLLAVSARCTGKMPLGAPCLPGNEVGLCPGTGRKWKQLPCDYRFLKVFSFLQKVKCSLKSYLTGTNTSESTGMARIWKKQKLQIFLVFLFHLWPTYCLFLGMKCLLDSFTDSCS